MICQVLILACGLVALCSLSPALREALARLIPGPTVVPDEDGARDG